jgi:4-hydroxybutyrate CoA-transferase
MASGLPKKVSAQEAVQAVQSGDRIVLPLCCGLPRTLVEALVQDHERLENVEIVSGLQIEYKFLEPGLEKAFTFRTWQCAPPIRNLLAKGTVKYIPMRQGDAAWMFSRNGIWPVKRALIQTSPPDRNGYMSLGVSISHALPTALEAETVIAEVNEQMPRVLGDSFVHTSQVHAIVESSRPLLEFPPPTEIGEKEKKIGAYVADLIPDGATLQIGIGAIPSAVIQSLRDKRNLKFFAMGVDGIVDLVEAGAVDPGRSISDSASIRVTEILGTKRLFDFVHDNPTVEGRPIHRTINPRVVAEIDSFVSVLSAIEIDLTGQVNAETVQGKQISAIGGSFDFLLGARSSRGGKSIIAMTATSPDGKLSRIVSTLPPGSAVTTPRHCVEYVVTEYGVADLNGKSISERAEALIGIAHPDFRADLRTARAT